MLILAVGLLATTGFANYSNHPSQSLTRSPFTGAGAGTAVSPYIITTPGQLDEVRNFLGSNFILGNDINLDLSPYNTDRGWVPIGTKPAPYTILDLSLVTGGSFTISGMDLYSEQIRTSWVITIPTTAAGIQHALYNGDIQAEVTDLGANRYGISDIESINQDNLIGTVTIEYVDQFPFSGVFNGNGKTISNMFIYGFYGQNYGLFGRTYGATVINLTLSNVNVTGLYYAGGLAGYTQNSTFNNCHLSGSVIGAYYVGGLIGMVYNDVNKTISNCSGSGTVSSATYYGGLVGLCYNATINSCSATSTVTSLVDDGGGLAGGLVGMLYNSEANNCYVTGTVSHGSGYAIGGLIGFPLASPVNNCYSTGAVTCFGPNAGGLFGNGGDTATGTYWNTVTSTQTNASGDGTFPGTMGRTTAEMIFPYTGNTYEGWDFSSIWRDDVTGTLNNGYPALRYPDYFYSLDVPVGGAVVTVTGGSANNGTGSVPDLTGLGFVPEQTFSFIGTGVLTISITTLAQMGAYWQSGTWHPVPNSGGKLVFVIDFDILGKGEIAIVTGNESTTLPIELSSFTAVQTALNNVQLKWVTQSESGVVGYYVHRSAANDLSVAAGISSLIAATNTSQAQSYSYADSEVSPGTWYYWLQNLDVDGSSNYYGPVSVIFTADNNDNTPIIPLVTSLNRIYPNPFNPTTTISYGLAKAERVNIQIFNIKGQLVRNLLSESKQMGTYRAVWNGTDDRGNVQSSGVYFIKLTAGTYSNTSKVMMLK